jgi:hypothetical protein
MYGSKNGIFHRLSSENYIFSPAANDQCLFLRGFLPSVLFLYLVHTLNLYFACICCLSFSLPVPLFMFPPIWHQKLNFFGLVTRGIVFLKGIREEVMILAKKFRTSSRLSVQTVYPQVFHHSHHCYFSIFLLSSLTHICNPKWNKEIFTSYLCHSFYFEFLDIFHCFILLRKM